MASSKHPLSLSEHLLSIIDPRLERKKDHLLVEVLLIAVLAKLCGAEHFTDFEDFGKAKQAWLRTFLRLPGGIPSHDTFRRVFSLIDPGQFAECFRAWSESLRQAVSQEIVAIDGKTLRRSYDRFANRKAIHVVSAWARENGLVLGQIKVDEKSNETTAIPELLRVLELSGCIVTIDAMGTQKAIATEICNADADYVLALKGNHGKMHEEVGAFLRDARARGFAGVAHGFHETVEKDHGRIETRRYWITEAIHWFEDRGQWEGLRSVGMVERIRETGGVATRETAFHLCSLAADARTYARAVRGHWSIENALHGSLDVTFGEDQCRVRSGRAAENLNILRHITLNLLRRDTTKKRGLKGKQKNAGWNHTYLLSLLAL